jgi:hypothetical protein
MNSPLRGRGDDLRHVVVIITPWDESCSKFWHVERSVTGRLAQSCINLMSETVSTRCPMRPEPREKYNPLRCSPLQPVRDAAIQDVAGATAVQGRNAAREGARQA